MDFLKKHYEKIALAAALIVLIVSAILLSLNVNQPGSELGKAPKHGSMAPLDQRSYSNAIASLNKPPLWTNALVDLFGITASATPGASPEGAQVVLTGIVRKPFKLLLKAYSYDTEKGEGYNFQINFQFRSRTFFIRAAGDPIKDRYEDTGYRIVKFEHKFMTVDNPNLGGKREKDVSELTVQHAEGKPVVLVFLQETEEQEPVALVRCGGTGPDHEYRRGQRIECGGKTYNVVDIDLKQMVIVDTRTEEQRIIKSQQ